MVAKQRRVLHVGFGFHGRTRAEELEPFFDEALDWLRYATTCWLVVTTSTPSHWHARLKPHLGEKDRMLIVEVDLSEGRGRLPPWVWEWIAETLEESGAES